MNMLSNNLDHFKVKGHITRDLRPDPKMVKVYFNAGPWNRKVNFQGWVPEHFMVDDRLNKGMAKVMAMAGIKSGWKNGVKKAAGDFHLVDFAFAQIAEKMAKPKSHLAARKRRGKA